MRRTLMTMCALALTASLGLVGCSDDDGGGGSGGDNGGSTGDTNVTGGDDGGMAGGDGGMSGGDGGMTGGDGGMTGDDGGGGMPSVSVSDQTADPANTVVVDSVWSDGPGWMVIHEDDGGSPGAVIGWSAVEDGSNSDVSVELDRDAEDGETLYAMLHHDDPADGNYTFGSSNGEEDKPVLVDGSPLFKPFEVSVGGNGGGSTSLSDGDYTWVWGGGDDACGQYQAAATVNVGNGDNSFQPKEVTVSSGDWVFFDFSSATTAHNVKYDAWTGSSTADKCGTGDVGAFQSMNYDSGVGCVQITKTGTFYYQCTVGGHCENGMWGSITVE